MQGPNGILLVVTTQMEHSGPNLVNLGRQGPFHGPKGQTQDYLGPQKGVICPSNSFLRTLRGGSKGPKMGQ